MNTPYAYRVQPISANGTPTGDPMAVSPFTDSYPMTCWKAADGPLVDRIKIPLGKGTTDAAWVSLAVADPGTGQPLSAVDAAGKFTDRVTLGPFH
jgi:hypothetical protein